jgi:hypothetical protein
MAALRPLVLKHPALAAALLALALAMKLLVPAGFMLDASGGTIRLELCSGTGPMSAMVAMPGMAHHSGHDDGQHHKADAPCPYASLTAPGLAGADPLLLALAIGFIVALGVWRSAPTPLPVAPRLRPPLRGPPLPA